MYSLGGRGGAWGGMGLPGRLWDTVCKVCGEGCKKRNFRTFPQMNLSKKRDSFSQVFFREKKSFSFAFGSLKR